MAEAALLELAAEQGLQPLELIQRRQRLGDPAQATLACRLREQQVTVFRRLRQQSLGERQRLCVSPIRLEAADSVHLDLKG